MKKTALAAALMLVTGVASAAPLSSLTLTGGSFLMGFGDTLTMGAYADMSVDGTYDGSAPAVVGSADSYLPTSIAAFTYFGSGVAVYTAASDGVNTGKAPVSGDITGNTLSLDLSSWTAFWNGTSFNQGSSTSLVPGSVCVGANCTTAINVTSFDAVTGAFTATWQAVVVGGSFNGQLATWNIAGTASAVPVPAAAWLFGSGLLGLAGVARRRMAA